MAVFRATRRCYFVVAAFRGRATAWSWVGAASRSRASLWLVIAAFTGPRDNWDLLARPSRPRVDLFVLAVLSGRATRGLLGSTAVLVLCWRGLSRPHVALSRCRCFHRATRQLGFVSTAFEAYASICLLSRSFQAVRCGCFLLSRPFRAVRQFGLLIFVCHGSFSGHATLLFCRRGL